MVCGKGGGGVSGGGPSLSLMSESPALDWRRVRWAHSRCPGENGCQLQTSAALFQSQGKAKRPEWALGQDKVERKGPARL